VSLDELLLVRHGESSGNVAREDAEADGAEVIDIDWRDADTPLSEHGRRQAQALGSWLGALPADRRPAHVWSSPYVRAADTARIAVAASELRLPVLLDERLRDRELGVLDRLTGHGVRTRFAAEAARRRLLGKLYYRPPGGESWADVALRLRSFLQDLRSERVDGTVLVVAHDAVILLFRYVLERLDEEQLLHLAKGASVGNASITRLARGTDGCWSTTEFGTVEHLEQQGVEPTHHGADHDAHSH
jgi:broad specificity phosphatase PhoE